MKKTKYKDVYYLLKFNRNGECIIHKYTSGISQHTIDNYNNNNDQDKYAYTYELNLKQFIEFVYKYKNVKYAGKLCKNSISKG